MERLVRISTVWVRSGESKGDIEGVKSIFKVRQVVPEFEWLCGNIDGGSDFAASTPPNIVIHP